MIDLAAPITRPWRQPETYWPRLLHAVRELDPPIGVLDTAALAENARELARRADGTPIRVASKSLRVREAIESVLALPGFAGVLAYTLREALWLAATVDDVVLGYPSTDREAIRRLCASPHAGRITLMVDSVAQLDLVDAVAPPAGRPELRVALDLDVGIDVPVLGHLGVRRSPLSTAEAAIALGRHVVARPGFTLVGLMGYEAQIAGVPDRYGSDPVTPRIVAAVKRRSEPQVHERRAAAVAGLRQLADLEFVNGGGTGSIESTVRDPSVTELTAGSGLFAGHLFDRYQDFAPAPATSVVLSVVRAPTSSIATAEGGGWIASGPAGADRLPLPVWPEGLRYLPREQAGEVQTPLAGGSLAVGDRVVLRHAKSGEAAERLAEYALVRDGELIGTTPTYRGEGRTFT